jgi:uncharacterized membrane protein
MLVKVEHSHIEADNTGEPIMAKTFSFAILHFTVAFTVGYLLTGSAMVGGLLAVIEPACNTVVFHFHEKAWKRFEENSPEQHARAVNLGWFHVH